MERPAVQKLLDDVRARKIDVIVVYKVDRLTRSLADFAKLVELFDAHGVSFISVTQARDGFIKALRDAHRWLDELLVDPTQTIESLAIREGKSADTRRQPCVSVALSAWRSLWRASEQASVPNARTSDVG